MTTRQQRILVTLLLLLATALAYGAVHTQSFLTYDDMQYVLGNSPVRCGLCWRSVAWAWTATEAANYHPLTWLAHMLDVQVLGIDAGRMKLVNLLLHLANTLLVLTLLRR